MGTFSRANWRSTSTGGRKYSNKVTGFSFPSVVITNTGHGLYQKKLPWFWWKTYESTQRNGATYLKTARSAYNCFLRRPE